MYGEDLVLCVCVFDGGMKTLGDYITLCVYYVCWSCVHVYMLERVKGMCKNVMLVCDWNKM
jgi:hypothetical protein